MLGVWEAKANYSECCKASDSASTCSLAWPENLLQRGRSSRQLMVQIYQETEGAKTRTLISASYRCAIFLR